MKASSRNYASSIFCRWIYFLVVDETIEMGWWWWKSNRPENEASRRKQSFLNLLRQNGRRETKVYCKVEKKTREESENCFSW